MNELEPPLRRLARRTGKHLRWTRSEGIARLIEEDGLDPLERLPMALRKWRWRRAHGVARGRAMPVWLLGVQRSGTNMLVRGLETAPEFQVHNESDRRAFRRFRLRPDHELAALVFSSRHQYVLFKPLCDSHRAAELLDRMPVLVAGRAIWAYRDVDGRARSAVAKFGDANLRVLREIAAGPSRRWQAQRLSPDSLELLSSFDYDAMTPADAAALFWYVRNRLFFELGLDRRADVVLSSYDAMLRSPATAMRALCAFLGMAWRPELTAGIAPRAGHELPRLRIDARIRERCDHLTGALDATAAAQLARLAAG